MNAVIALCHFCELHGPSILFCTQAFHCINHNPEDVLNGAEASLSACGNFNHSSLVWFAKEKETVFEEEPNSEERTTETPKKSHGSEPRQSTCVACSSLQQGEPGLISIDRESHISYISRQYPEDQELYSIVRHACVRSLSCEVCPGREGPIMFGDEASGYVFSHTFFLKDSQSRGFQRWYSIICVMMDRVYLVNSWQFLITNFRQIIDKLQNKADTTYRAEKVDNPIADQRLHMPAIQFHLNNNQFIRTRGGNQHYRSLVDLVGDKSIFQYLHKYFAWILKASGQRYCEQLVEGPSLADYSLLEGADENLRQKEIGPVVKSLRHLSKFLPHDEFKKLACHIVIGDQLIVRGRNSSMVSSVLNALMELIPSGCCRVEPHAMEYQDSWKCNFLGLTGMCKIPDDVLSSNLYILVNVDLDVNRDVESSEKINANSFKIEGKECESCPTYLTDILNGIYDEDFTDSVFATMLSTLKDEWMNKVKVMFKFSKCGSRSTDEKNKLLEVLNAKPEDEIMLKYWMTSLSRPYRTHLLSCASQNSVQRTGANGEVFNKELFFAIP